MAVMLIQGTVSHLERNASSVRFRIGEHQLDVVHQPDLFLLEDGVAVQLLVEADPAAMARMVDSISERNRQAEARHRCPKCHAASS